MKLGGILRETIHEVYNFFSLRGRFCYCCRVVIRMSSVASQVSRLSAFGEGRLRPTTLCICGWCCPLQCLWQCQLRLQCLWRSSLPTSILFCL